MIAALLTIAVAAPVGLAPCPPSPNCVRSYDEDPTHAVEPLPLGDPATAHGRLQAALLADPRVEVVDASPTWIRATATSAVFRFVDDIELWITPDVVHVRSASRVGWGDLGVNRARVERLRRRLAEPSATPALR